MIYKKGRKQYSNALLWIVTVEYTHIMSCSTNRNVTNICKEHVSTHQAENSMFHKCEIKFIFINKTTEFIYQWFQQIIQIPVTQYEVWRIQKNHGII
jgi:hypothetical protein